jgi:hypothetical protein
MILYNFVTNYKKNIKMQTSNQEMLTSKNLDVILFLSEIFVVSVCFDYSNNFFICFWTTKTNSCSKKTEYFPKYNLGALII